MRPTWTSAGNLQAVLLGLASGGVCLAAVSPRRRCALAAPFHPCLCADRATHAIGGVISVALSRGFPRVGSPDHPALWCPDFPRRAEPPRLPGLPRSGYPCDADGCWRVQRLSRAARGDAEPRRSRARGCHAIRARGSARSARARHRRDYEA